MSLPSRFDEWLYPELRAFRSQEDRKRALARCTASNWPFAVAAGGGVAVWMVIWFSYIEWPLALFLVPTGIPKFLGMGILLLSLLLGIFAVMLLSSWLGSFPTRKRLRQLWADEKLQECRSCGYNLTGNRSGVCPECGAAVPEQQASGKAGGE